MGQAPLASETYQLGFSYDQIIMRRRMDASNHQLNPVASSRS
jgi:hypothetical protein